MEKGLYAVSVQSPLLVIDGQQRLTTVTLLIEALARAVGDAEPVDGFSAKKLGNYYVLNPEEPDYRRYKLLLSQTDKDSLIALLKNAPQPTDASIRVAGNFALFTRWVAELGDDLAPICEGLATGAMRDLFGVFRRAVLALDNAVVEEFKKLYVAYKAETNFVDVIPQAKRLVLSVNVDPHDIEDPRGLTRDVTGLGRWGNGSVELGLSSVDELPCAMGIVRQAFEQQMGAEE